MSHYKHERHLELLRCYARIVLQHLKSEYPFDENIRQNLSQLRTSLKIRPDEAIAIETRLIDNIEQFLTYRNNPVSERCLFDMIVSLERPPLPPNRISPSSVLKGILTTSAASAGTCLLLIGGLSLGNSFLPARALRPFIDTAAVDLASTLLMTDSPEGYWGRLATYEGQLGFLLERFDIQPRWFDTLAADWVAFTQRDWQVLSDAQKIEVAIGLQERLITVLHPDTWGMLGPYTEAQLVKFTDKRKAGNFDLARTDKQADVEFYRVFPELQGQSIGGTAFVDVWYTLRESVIKDSLLERI